MEENVYYNNTKKMKRELPAVEIGEVSLALGSVEGARVAAGRIIEPADDREPVLARAWKHQRKRTQK